MTSCTRVEFGGLGIATEWQMPNIEDCCEKDVDLPFTYGSLSIAWNLRW